MVSENIEELLTVYNESFLTLLNDVLDTFNINAEVRKKLSAQTRIVSVNDVKNASESTLANNVSNAQSRMKGFLKEDNGVIRQLYRKQFSAFMKEVVFIKLQRSDFIADYEFFNKLGACRNLIDRGPELWGRAATVISSYLDSTYTWPQYSFFNFGIIRGKRNPDSNEALMYIPTEHSIEEHITSNKESRFYGVWSETLLNMMQDKINEEYKSPEKYPYSRQLKYQGRIISISANRDIQDFSKLEIALNKILGSYDSTTQEFKLYFEVSGDCYATSIDKYSTYKKLFISSDFINREEGNAFMLGGFNTSLTDITYHHTCAFPFAISTLQEKVKSLLELTRTSPEPEIFLNKLGELAYLYINIMPYRGGSSAIAEWLMGGFTKLMGIELGTYEQNRISWDFSAFIARSAEEYGLEFKHFFTEILVHQEKLGAETDQPIEFTSLRNGP